jgi:hypothetical protein
MWAVYRVMAKMSRLQRVCVEVESELRSRGYNVVMNSGEGYAMCFSGGRAVPDKKYQKIGGAYSRQLEQIDASSTSDADAKRRIIALILDGRDPGQSDEERKVSVSEVDRLVNERVTAILAERLGQARVPPEQLIHEAPVVQSAPKATVVVPAGPQSPPRPRPQPKPEKAKAGKGRVPPPKSQRVEVTDCTMVTWTKRAAEAGLPAPKPLGRDPGTVDGRWLNHWVPKWQAWVQQNVGKQDMSMPIAGVNLAAQ